MKKNNKFSPNIYEIVYLIRKGRNMPLTTSELEELQAWVDQNPENLELYNRLIADDLSDKVDTMVSIDTAKHYDQLRKVNKQKSTIRWFAYAGLTAASISLFVLFRPFFSDNSLPSTTNNNVQLIEQGNAEMITLSKGTVLKDLVVLADSVYEVSSLIANVSSKNSVDQTIEKPVIIHTPVGKTMNIRLFDGSTVYLNSNSEISFYNSYTNSNERRVDLNGEAFFEVTKDAKRPFVVMNNGQEIKVLGTSFNVNGYDSHSKFKLGLATGKVEVKIKDLDYIATLTPGNQVEYNKDKNSVMQQQVDINNIGLWRTGVYVFENYTIEELTKDLEQMYPIKFKFQGDVPKYLFSGEISRKEGWQKALQKLEMTRRVKFIVEGNEITIRNQ